MNTNDQPLVLHVDESKFVCEASYGHIQFTKGEHYDLYPFPSENYDPNTFPFPKVEDIASIVLEIFDLEIWLGDFAYKAEEPPFDRISERGRASKPDYDPYKDWYDFVRPEDLRALNEIVRKWTELPISPEEEEMSTIPTDPYSSAWHTLYEGEYDTELIGIGFLEGRWPGDNMRRAVLETTVEEANSICEANKIGLRFEYLECDQGSA